MILRWSGAVAYDDEQARQRLQSYLETIGYRCVQREPELLMRRGSLWRGFVSASPRQILTGIVARTQPWGAHTLVDVDLYIFQRGRSWRESDAELLVEEAREMIRYLQEGDADFERLNQIERRAVRQAQRAALLTLALVAVLSLLVGGALVALQMPFPLAAVVGGLIGGVAAGFFFSLLTRHRG
ncbi:hypothetical protein HRbin15_00274 [bacterium HR15]|nr:hypothetical protein HRbin15_00274 [bacterium HR15]